MSFLYVWLIAYVAPALLAGTAIKILPKKRTELNLRDALMMHVALIASVVLSQYFIYSSGLTFPWFPNALSVAVYILSILISIALVGSRGIWYGISALIQQLTMASIAFLLLPVFPFYMVALLIIPVYVWCHRTQTNNWQLRTILFLIWGAISIYLFLIFPNVYLIAALHTLLGSILISRSLLYCAD